MQNKLKEALGVEANLIKGYRGQFEISVDGKSVFSKKELNRFPEDGEVEKLIS